MLSSLEVHKGVVSGYDYAITMRNVIVKYMGDMLYGASSLRKTPSWYYIPVNTKGISNEQESAAQASKAGAQDLSPRRRLRRDSKLIKNELKVINRTSYELNRIKGQLNYFAHLSCAKCQLFCLFILCLSKVALSASSTERRPASEGPRFLNSGFLNSGIQAPPLFKK